MSYRPGPRVVPFGTGSSGVALGTSANRRDGCSLFPTASQVGSKPMAEILGLGVTHSPLLVGSDDRMAGIFERVLNSDRLPAAARDPANWPSAMRHEWSEHQAGRAAS